jgi:hypothetical protein
MYFVFMYENRTMKPLKIVVGGMRENDEGVNFKICCKHISGVNDPPV